MRWNWLKMRCCPLQSWTQFFSSLVLVPNVGLSSVGVGEWFYDCGKLWCENDWRCYVVLSLVVNSAITCWIVMNWGVLLQLCDWSSPFEVCDCVSCFDIVILRCVIVNDCVSCIDIEILRCVLVSVRSIFSNWGLWM